MRDRMHCCCCGRGKAGRIGRALTQIVRRALGAQGAVACIRLKIRAPKGSERSARRSGGGAEEAAQSDSRVCVWGGGM